MSLSIYAVDLDENVLGMMVTQGSVTRVSPGICKVGKLYPAFIAMKTAITSALLIKERDNEYLISRDAVNVTDFFLDNAPALLSEFTPDKVVQVVYTPVGSLFEFLSAIEYKAVYWPTEIIQKSKLKRKYAKFYQDGDSFTLDTEGGEAFANFYELVMDKEVQAPFVVSIKQGGLSSYHSYSNPELALKLMREQPGIAEHPILALASIYTYEGATSIKKINENLYYIQKAGSFQALATLDL